MKDFSWNINPWNALLFENTLKQLSILVIDNYGFILNTCHDTAIRAEIRVGFPVIFSQLRWPIEPKFSQVCYFILSCDIHEVWAFDNTFYRKCPMDLKAALWNRALVLHFPAAEPPLLKIVCCAGTTSRNYNIFKAPPWAL